MKVKLLAKKLGMSSLFEGGKMVPVTLLEVANSVVTEVEDNRVTAGFFDAGKNINKPKKGYFAKKGVEAKNLVREFVVDDASAYEVGQEVPLSLVEVGSFLDATATSKGKGFAGAMKRWNFGGLEATHGISVSHRSHGSTGQCQDPGRVFKGKKMAGQMGNKKITVQNLKVVRVDAASEEGGAIIFVKGAVVGHKGAVITLKNAVKKGNK